MSTVRTILLIVVSLLLAMFLQRLMWHLTWTLIRFIHMAMWWVLIFIILVFATRRFKV